jgi:hypothetical protein
MGLGFGYLRARHNQKVYVSSQQGRERKRKRRGEAKK